MYATDDGGGTRGNLDAEIDEEGLISRNLDLRLDELVLHSSEYPFLRESNNQQIYSWLIPSRSIAKLPERWPEDGPQRTGHGSKANANGQTEDEQER